MVWAGHIAVLKSSSFKTVTVWYDNLKLYELTDPSDQQILFLTNLPQIFKLKVPWMTTKMNLLNNEQFKINKSYH